MATNLNDTERTTAAKAVIQAIQARLKKLKKSETAWIDDASKVFEIDSKDPMIPASDKGIQWATGYLQTLLVRETDEEKKAREEAEAKRSAEKIRSDLEYRFSASKEVLGAISAYLPGNPVGDETDEEEPTTADA